MTALIQGSPAWFALRKTKITATDASIILRLSPWKTPQQLWEEKLFKNDEEQENEKMKEGKHLEEIARDKFNMNTGMQMNPDVIFHKEYSWMMASLDGIDATKSHILEIKCGNKAFQFARKGIIPNYYYAQVQHQIACADLDKAYYFNFFDFQEILMEIPRDDVFIENMIEEEQRFYNCMMQKEPPESFENDFLKEFSRR